MSQELVEFENGLWKGDPVTGCRVKVTLPERNGGRPFIVQLDGRSIWSIIDDVEASGQFENAPDSAPVLPINDVAEIIPEVVPEIVPEIAPELPANGDGQAADVATATDVDASTGDSGDAAVETAEVAETTEVETPAVAPKPVPKRPVRVPPPPK